MKIKICRVFVLDGMHNADDIMIVYCRRHSRNIVSRGKNVCLFIFFVYLTRAMHNTTVGPELAI